jgi:uncharacterized protein YdcH (DUF465 family)
MERNDWDRIARACQLDSNIDRLLGQHRELEKELSRLSHRGFLTEQEAQRERELKARKLRAADEMIKRARELNL